MRLCFEKRTEVYLCLFARQSQVRQYQHLQQEQVKALRQKIRLLVARLKHMTLHANKERRKVEVHTHFYVLSLYVLREKI